MKKTVKAVLFFPVVYLVLSGTHAHGVMVWDNNADSDYADFYIYNNTLADIKKSGDFGHTAIPDEIPAMSVAADAKVDLSDSDLNTGHLVMTLTDPVTKTINTFVMSAISWKKEDEWYLDQDTTTHDYSDTSWHYTYGDTSPSGVVSVLCSIDGYVEQIWNDKYVVTLTKDDPENYNHEGNRKIILMINPNTSGMTYIQDHNNTKCCPYPYNIDSSWASCTPT